MNAVWQAAWAAVRRRKLQTIVIGVVVCAASATLVMALGLLEAASAPFDRAFAAQSGAHLSAAFDPAKVSEADLGRVVDSAGPFLQATVDTSSSDVFLGSLTVVGRSDPGGAVDRLSVWQGRWATNPGEIVLNRAPGTTGRTGVGSRITLPDRPALTVVGFAYSVTGSADAWVTPVQAKELHPTALQMLYRFAKADTAADVAAGQAQVTTGLPTGALLGTLSHLTVKDKATSELGVFIPFLMIFGVLGLVVAVLIVANVVSGAVVAGFRHIGMLKAIGFTPNQVMAVYLVMVSIPAVAGCALGTVAGNLFAKPVVQDAVDGFGVDQLSFAPWVNVVAALGMPLLVGSAALVPALRARRLPAARAISAGTTAHTGRALRIQRWLSGTRLPRSVSLGLGMPFARAGRSILTLAAVVFGVMTVTLAVGVTMSMNAYNEAVRPNYTDRVELLAGPPLGLRIPGEKAPAARLSDADDESMLRSLPGATALLAMSQLKTEVAGGTQKAVIVFYRGDATTLGPRVLTGHWPGRGEVVVPSRFLNQRGLSVGDTITVAARDNRTQVRIVGVVLTNNADQIFADWSTSDALVPGARADSYQVRTAPGTDRDTFTAAALARDPGLHVLPPRDGTSSTAVIIISAAVVLTLVLGAVAALGVFNTVVLNARERRRDLGMLKSIGMTPRQVTVLLVTSMGALGLVGGLIGVPFGIAVHQVVVPAMARAGQADAVDILMNVYHAPAVALLALTGLVIAVLGAVVPARVAARLSIATVLHNE